MQKVFDINSEMIHEFVRDIADLVLNSEMQDKYNMMVAIIGCATLSEVIAANCGMDKKTWNTILEKSKEMRDHIVSMVDTGCKCEACLEEENDDEDESDEDESDNDQKIEFIPLHINPKKKSAKTNKDRVVVGPPIIGKF